VGVAGGAVGVDTPTSALEQAARSRPRKRRAAAPFIGGLLRVGDRLSV
jgi:hypothetical protein